MATDIGRRMEMVAANVGRRMDRMYDEAVELSTRGSAGGKVEDRIAPMLGDSAALLDRLEFHPAELRNPDPNPNPDANPDSKFGHRPGPARFRRGRPPGPPPPPGMPPLPGAPKPPPPPGPPPAIVVDVPRVVEQAQRAAAAAGKSAGVDVGAIVADAIKLSGPGIEAGVAAVNEAIAREVAARTAPGKPEMAVTGRWIEVPVMKNGKMVGKANATLNLDRTLRSVLGFARRDQGEIPFAFDLQGKIYTLDPRARGTLESLGITGAAAASAVESPRRIGDWLVVARKDASGLVFGIARPIGASLREIRRLSFRNLSVGLLVIALACIGIVPISRRHDAARVIAERWREAARGRRLQGAGGGPIPRRVRQPRGGVQQDGRGSREASGARRRTGAPAPRARALAADSDRNAAARSAQARHRRDQWDSRFPRARSAATSSTTSRCRTAAWRCWSATSPARASAPRC